MTKYLRFLSANNSRKTAITNLMIDMKQGRLATKKALKWHQREMFQILFSMHAHHRTVRRRSFDGCGLYVHEQRQYSQSNLWCQCSVLLMKFIHNILMRCSFVWLCVWDGLVNAFCLFPNIIPKFIFFQFRGHFPNSFQIWSIN